MRLVSFQASIAAVRTRTFEHETSIFMERYAIALTVAIWPQGILISTAKRQGTLLHVGEYDDRVLTV